MCWAQQNGDAYFSLTCVERGTRHVRKKKGKMLIAIWFLFFSTHARTHFLFLSLSLELTLSFAPSFTLPLSFALSLSPSYMRSYSSSRYHTTCKKMQRITIFFLSPFVHKVESTFRGSFSIFTRAPCKITTFSLTVAPIHILFYFFLLMMSRTRSVFSRGTLIPYIVLWFTIITVYSSPEKNNKMYIYIWR